MHPRWREVGTGNQMNTGQRVKINYSDPFDTPLILLDMAIGEYYVAAGIRYIDHQQLPEKPGENGLFPFKSLPEIFYEYIDRKG